MALDGTYDGLKASIAAWLDREDLSAAIPDFIMLTEGRLNDQLRTRDMVTSAIIQSSDGTAQLPSDFIEAITIVALPSGVAQVTDDGVPITDENGNPIVDAPATGSTSLVLRNMDSGWTIGAYSGFSGGWPILYSLSSDILTIYPTGAATLQLTYYGKVPALSADNQTNWLLTKRPQVYLYGALLESAPFLQDDGRVALWKAAFDQAVTDYQLADQMARWSNAGMRLPGPTP